MVGNSATGINLNNGAYANYRTFTINSATTITNTGNGVYGGAVTISTAGSIASSGGSGIDTTGVGTVTNSGKVAAGGSVGEYGVKINAGPSTLNNDGAIIGWVGASANDASTIYNGTSGTITGSLIGVLQGEVTPSDPGGTVLNKGTIAATGAGAQGGVVMQGSSFRNYSSGVVLSTTTGVYSHVRLTNVENDGKIIAGAGDFSLASYGVQLAAGGEITNTSGGTISGNTAGILIQGTAVPVYNDSGATITGGGFGIFTSIAGESFSNSGTISQTATATSQVTGLGTNFAAIYLKSGGDFTNSSGGLVEGAESGVRMQTAAGTIANFGKIAGATGIYLNDGGAITNAVTAVVTGVLNAIYTKGAPATITNSGSIMSNGAAPADHGVLLADGGLISNATAGTIAGGTGIGFGNGGTVTNAGLVKGVNAGIYITNSGGTIASNTGTISGGTKGVYYKGLAGHLTNAGSIISTSGTALVFNDGGTVTNAAGGVISGGTGIRLTDGGTIKNSAKIAGTGTGIYINAAGGTLVNSAAGTVSGGSKAVYYKGSAGKLTNDGLIASAAGTAIAFNTGGTVTNLGGATIAGGVIGISISGLAGTVTNGALITASSGSAVMLGDGGLVTNSSTISGSVNGVDIAAAAGSVSNTGSINGGSGDGILLASGGIITNSADGTVTGNYGLKLANGGSLTNSGVISGASSGVETAGGTIINNASASIYGIAHGVLAVGSPVYALNSGTIRSSAEAAIDLTAGGTVNNTSTGLITGASYGVHAYGGVSSVTNYGIIDATAGTGVDIAAGTFDNVQGATIQGTSYGVVFSGPGTGINAGLIEDSGIAGLALGNGVSFDNTPTGTIIGTTGLIFTGTGSTMFNEGTIASDSGGDAVSFSSGGVNFLTLTTGQALIGTIDGGGSDSTIALDGTGTLTNTITDFGPSSSLDVAPGADWTAYGSWQIATATNDGTFQPGIIGTPLNLSGNFVQNADGTLQVIVTPAATNQLLATGTARLDGALNYSFAPGTYVAKSYPFLVTGGATTGTFTTITYNGAPTNLLHTTTYQTNDTDLVLYNPASPPPASNPVANPPLVVTPIDDSIFSDENQQSALNAQAASMSLLQKAAEGDQEGAESAVCASEAGTTPADVEPDKVTGMEKLANAVGNAFCGAGGWIQGSGTVFNADGNANVDGYRADTAGFLAGIGKVLNTQGTRLGVAVGYDESNVKTSLGSKGDVDTVRVGLYGSQPVGVFTIAADLMYGHFDTTTSRVTGIGYAGSKESGNIWSGGIEAETLLPVDGFDIIPGAGIRIASVSTGRFAESAPGAEAAFAIDGANSGYTSVQPFVNLDLSTKYLTPTAIAIMPDVSAGYIYEAGTRGRSVTVDSQDGTVFETAHLGLAGSAAELQAGLSAGKGNWAFYARYTADLGGNWTSQTGEVGLRITF